MRPFAKNKFIIAAALLLMILPHAAHADPLVYRGSNDPVFSGGSSNTAPGEMTVMPVAYSTNYETQYSPYASFMQSPYTDGNLQQAYAPVYPPLQSGVDPYGGGTSPSNDPFGANEVSPYSRYSPYIEIIGEGSDYELGIDDVVTILVRNQPDFSGRFIVDPHGNIQYNFVGDIPALGKTKEELKADIVERLREFVRYPEVAVMVSEYRSKAVYVFGFVNRPGKYAMKGNKITVKEAIVAAGLPRMDGSLKRVYVIRPSEFREEGTAAKKQVDLRNLIERGDSGEDFILEPGDTLIVHQRYFDKFVNNFSRIVGPVFQTAAVYELGFGSARRQGGYFRNNR